jgi:predicted dehydrogenase
MAVVGCGHLGSMHARAAAAVPGVVLAATVDLIEERARAAGGALAATDHRAVLGNVDAAVIATPTTTHAAVALDFVRSGVPVLVEKPLAATAEEARALVEEAARAGVALQVGHIERFNPAVRAARDLIRGPLFVESHRLAIFVPRSLDVDVVRDLMIHDLDLVLHFVGAPLESVDAVGVAVLTGTADIANARLRFANGAVANLTASRVSREKVRKIRFFARNAYVSVDCLAKAVEAYRLAPGDGPLGRRVEGGPVPVEAGDALSEQLDSFVRAVREGAPVEATGTEGLAALEAAIRIERGVEESLARMGLCG